MNSGKKHQLRDGFGPFIALSLGSGLGSDGLCHHHHHSSLDLHMVWVVEVGEGPGLYPVESLHRVLLNILLSLLLSVLVDYLMLEEGVQEVQADVRAILVGHYQQADLLLLLPVLDRVLLLNRLDLAGVEATGLPDLMLRLPAEAASESPGE